jgi:hypothetical protein
MELNPQEQSSVRFTAILGLQDHTRCPKKLYDDHVMEFNQMHFMYEKDEYKLSKVEGFKPFFVLHQLLRKTLSPKEGDSSRVPQYERNILHAISDEERFNVFNFIFLGNLECACQQQPVMRLCTLYHEDD